MCRILKVTGKRHIAEQQSVRVTQAQKTILYVKSLGGAKRYIEVNRKRMKEKQKT